jgi:hypothetical protein
MRTPEDRASKPAEGIRPVRHVISYDAVAEDDESSSARVWTIPNLLSLLRLLGLVTA